MLLDSNIIIYAAQPEHEPLRQFIQANVCCTSIISYIEVLGYHRLTAPEKEGLEAFFAVTPMLPLTDDIAQLAIHLRQQRKLSLGDSIVAATALHHQMPVITHNTTDFEWVADLDVIDPLAD
jgi:predicted nucleic acid-binding protein